MEASLENVNEIFKCNEILKVKKGFAIIAPNLLRHKEICWLPSACEFSCEPKFSYFDSQVKSYPNEVYHLSLFLSYSLAQ